MKRRLATLGLLALSLPAAVYMNPTVATAATPPLTPTVRSACRVWFNKFGLTEESIVAKDLERVLQDGEVDDYADEATAAQRLSNDANGVRSHNLPPYAPAEAHWEAWLMDEALFGSLLDLYAIAGMHGVETSLTVAAREAAEAKKQFGFVTAFLKQIGEG